MRKSRSKNLGKRRAGRQTKQTCFGKSEICEECADRARGTASSEVETFPRLRECHRHRDTRAQGETAGNPRSGDKSQPRSQSEEGLELQPRDHSSLTQENCRRHCSVRLFMKATQHVVSPLIRLNRDFL
jgi:hypothetical protein